MVDGRLASGVWRFLCGHAARKRPRNLPVLNPALPRTGYLTDPHLGRFRIRRYETDAGQSTGASWNRFRVLATQLKIKGITCLTTQAGRGRNWPLIPCFHRFPQGVVHKGLLATFYGSFSRCLPASSIGRNDNSTAS